MANIKVLSLNCRVWTRDIDKTSPYYWRTRMEKIAEMISKQQPDILCLQELSWPATKYIPKEYKRVTHGFSHSIWVKRTIFIATYGHGWRIFADYADFGYFNNFRFRVINVHGRWTERARKKMLKIFDRWNNVYPVIAMGDFNNTYEQMGIPYLAYRKLGYDTFQNWTKPESHGEIDLLYHSVTIPPSFIEKIEWAGTRASDHWPIVGEFEI